MLLELERAHPHVLRKLVLGTDASDDAAFSGVCGRLMDGLRL